MNQWASADSRNTEVAEVAEEVKETENPRWRRMPSGLAAEVISFVATTSYPENEFIIVFYPPYQGVKQINPDDTDPKKHFNRWLSLLFLLFIVSHVLLNSMSTGIFPGLLQLRPQYR